MGSTILFFMNRPQVIRMLIWPRILNWSQNFSNGGCSTTGNLSWFPEEKLIACLSQEGYKLQIDQNNLISKYLKRCQWRAVQSSWPSCTKRYCPFSLTILNDYYCCDSTITTMLLSSSLCLLLTLLSKVAYFVALDNLINPGDGYNSPREQNGEGHYFPPFLKTQTLSALLSDTSTGTKS